MSDQFPITAPQVTASAGVVSDYVINLAFNQLTLAVRSALNTLAAGTPPIGPAGGDLSGSYPNPTVAKVHATSGTIDNVVIGGLVPAAGTFTTLSASSLAITSALSVANGGTGLATLTAHAVLLGEGTSNVAFAAPGAAGQMLLSTGATTDPAFGNNPTINGGTVNNAVIGGTTPAAGTFTALSSTSGALNGTVGATTPNTGSFTTLAASGTVSGTGFTNLFAAPPSIGSTTPGTGAFTTLSATSTVSGAGFTARFSTPGPIGNTTPSTGAFTTITATGTITPDQLNGIVGTTTNNNANAGSVGEFPSPTNLSAVSLTTGTSANVASVSLTAGDWDVEAVGRFNPAGSTTMSALAVGVSTTSATLGALGTLATLNTSIPAGTGNSLPTPTVRISLSATTTVFAVAQASFAVSTMTADGFIRARRVR